MGTPAGLRDLFYDPASGQQHRLSRVEAGFLQIPGNNNQKRKPCAWSYFGILSNELGTPKILHCPANKLKRNSIATDWSTATVGFWNTTAKASGADVDAVHRSQVNKYGKTPGYDSSISYSVFRTRRTATRAGQSVGLTPETLISFDYNVSQVGNRGRQNRTGYPNFDPLPGGCYRAWRGNDRDWIKANSGPGADQIIAFRMDRLGFVVGQTDEQKWDVHGSQRGNVVLADASVTQVGIAQDFETLGWNLFQAMYQAKKGGQTDGRADDFIVLSPF